ncbi:MAG: hypothetical protein K2N55_07595, partial [Lachnospiraceae bacterium]|nr:hypothetical protein [Lachnospiraceae bacterium]
MSKKVLYNSRRYHEFFEGYTERIVMEKGRERIERIYTGDYYCPVISSGSRKLRKMLYCTFFLLAVMDYGYLATRPLEMNISKWSGICQGFLALALLWLLAAVFYYGTAKEKMTVRIYRSASVRLRQLSFAAAALFGLMSIIYFLLAIVGGGSWQDFVKLFPMSVSGCALLFAMYRLEEGTEYEIEANDTIAA